MNEQFQRERQQGKAVSEEELKAVSRQNVQRRSGKTVRPQATRKEAARRSRGCDAEARRRRALHALRALPWRLATDRRFTDSFFVILDFHLRYADEHGCHRVSIPEITNRLKLSRSTVLRAHKLLEEEGVLAISRARVASDMNATNVYTLSEELMAGRRAPIPRSEERYSDNHARRQSEEQISCSSMSEDEYPAFTSEENPTAIDIPSQASDDKESPEDLSPEQAKQTEQNDDQGGSVINETPKEDSRYLLSTTSQKPCLEHPKNINLASKNAHQLSNVSEQSLSTLSSKKAKRIFEPCTLSEGEELKVLRSVSAILHPDDTKVGEITWDRLVGQAESLLAEEIPLLYGPLWQIGLKRHGSRAIAAVFETILLTRTGYVHTPHGYLWGILRKRRGEIAPHVSMRRFLMQRALPKAPNFRTRPVLQTASTFVASNPLLRALNAQSSTRSLASVSVLVRC